MYIFVVRFLLISVMKRLYINISGKDVLYIND